jgi:hypothetical protein
MDGLGVSARPGFRLREKIHLLGWNEIILRFEAVQRTAEVGTGYTRNGVKSAVGLR